MSISQHEKFRIRKFVKTLEQIKGRHTELVSVYIPAGYDMNKIIGHLNQEQGTATNIKSTGTRKNVISSLEKMIQHLRLFNQTPKNGLAVFSGNFSEREGQQDIQVFSIEPPLPLNIRIYRCDKEFVLEHLTEMCDDKESYGLVVMDRRDANIALLKGKTIVPLTSTGSNVPGKTRAGGQSAQRFERLREGAAKEFYYRIGELMKEQFLGKDEVRGIIVGGPGPTKYDFTDGNFITNEVKKKIIGIKDLSYTGDFGVQELVEKSDDILAEEEIIKEKQLMARFFNLLSKDSAMIEYGKDAVMQLLIQGAVETLLLSEGLDDKEIEIFEEEAQKLGTIVEIVSTETREGVQLKEIGKVGAILRYRKEN
jgi:peptide chain release factor subunit 1